MRSILSSCLAAALVLGATTPAFAADFSINPTRVELNAKKAVDTITLVNGEDRDISFEVTLTKWSQDANGQWSETPSKDLVVYPALLKMPTKGKGIVRVGSKDKSVSAPAVEGTYRLSIQELPGGPNPEGTAVRLLTKVSLPIFIAPVSAKKDLSLTASGSGAGLSLTIKNAGTVHMNPQEAKIQFLDASGNALGVETKLPSNTDYVLAGASSTIKHAWPANCAAVKSVKLSLAEDKELQAPVSGSCK